MAWYPNRHQWRVLWGGAAIAALLILTSHRVTAGDLALIVVVFTALWVWRLSRPKAER